MSGNHYQHSKCKHICLYGGPGVGKSGTASGLFSKMKRNHMICEYVTEYAKDRVFSKDFFTLGDQLMILAKQHHSWYKLESQVDYTINDGPFLLSLAYVQDGEHLPKDTFTKLIIEMYKSYDTLNVFLERDAERNGYQQYGRNQTLDEAIELDNKIKQILTDNDIPYVTVKVGKKTIKNIFKIIKEMK